MENSRLNVEVSCFKGYDIPADPVTINLMSWLTSSKYAGVQQQIRELLKEGATKEQIKPLKTKLPAITSSGVFSYRGSDFLTKHNGLIQFDIDWKENEHIANYKDLKSIISHLENVAYCGESVSGTGYWGLIPIAYPKKHAEHFTLIQNYFNSFGIVLDDKPKNVASLRGYSCDPEAYFNHNATVLEKYHIEPKRKKRAVKLVHTNDFEKQNFEYCLNQIATKRIDITENYNTWLSIGFNFAGTFGESGRNYFHIVSQYYHGYSEQNTNFQFDACLKSKRVSEMGTFYSVCKDAGICYKHSFSANQPNKANAAPKILQPYKEPQKPITAKEPVKELQPAASSDTALEATNAPTIINENDIIKLACEVKTGEDLNHVILGLIETSQGFYDVLFYNEGDCFAVPYGEDVAIVKAIENTFNKRFEHMLIDGSSCWGCLVN